MLTPVPIRDAWPGFGRKHEAIAVALACAVFVALAGLMAARQTYPYFDDVAYLEQGNLIRSLGGPLEFVRALFQGRFEESNRHPLYLALLALVARPDPRYHRDAQALTIFLGVVALLSCWWIARRHLGRPAAAIAIALIATNKLMIECASREWCEPLLVAVWAPAVGAILDAADPSSPRHGRAWLRAGFWSGLALLTKGTGIFLPVSLGLALFIRERLRAVVDRRGWMYAAAFAVTASPLLVRNLVRYGTPLYNMNTRYLWIDRLPDYAEVYAPQAEAALPHGFFEYLRHVTPAAFAWRFLAGLGETIFNFLDAMAPIVERVGGPLHVAALLAGLIAAAAAIDWIRRSPHGLARTFLLVHMAWSFAFLLVFSANGGNSRYFVPLAATVLIPALSARIVADVARAGSFVRSKWATRTTALVAAAVGIAFVAHPAPLRGAGMAEVQDWLIRHLEPGDVYAMDARTHLQPRWLTPKSRQILVSASWQEKPVDPPLLLEHLRQEKVRFVVLDGAALAHMGAAEDPAARRYLFYDVLPLEPDGSLPLRGFPGGLLPVYVDPASPRRWVVLETPWSGRHLAVRGASAGEVRDGGGSRR